MQGSASKKMKKETFTTYLFFRDLYNHDPVIIQSYLQPLRAHIFNSAPVSHAAQFYCKFANDSVLNAFLEYLARGQLPELVGKKDEATVELVMEYFEAFKKYYPNHKKEVEQLKLTEDRVAALKQRFLFLDNVSKEYNSEVKLQSSQSKVALLVLKNGGNIFLAAVSRNPSQKPSQPSQQHQAKKVIENGDIQGHKDDRDLLYRQIATLFLVLMVLFIIHTAFTSRGLLHRLGTLP